MELFGILVVSDPPTYRQSLEPILVTPGDNYVDWVAIDGYDRKYQGNTAFATVFTPFYKEFTSHNKPLMIGETGATIDQVAFLQGAQTPLHNNFPNIKTVDYFDAVGPAGNWTLQWTGLSQFSQMVKSPYFKPKI